MVESVKFAVHPRIKAQKMLPHGLRNTENFGGKNTHHLGHKPGDDSRFFNQLHDLPNVAFPKNPCHNTPGPDGSRVGVKNVNGLFATYR